jgi:TOTE conflict system protein, potentially ssRNA-binding
MDVAPEQEGIIDHVNKEKSLLHVIVARGVDGTCPISAYPETAKVGATVAVRLSRHRGRNGERTRIISIVPSEKSPAPDVCRHFREATEVTNSGLGFTQSDIFIPPNIVSASGIDSGDQVEGIAILSYDKKRSKWGMKAVEARPVSKRGRNFDGENEGHDDYD